MSPIPGRDLEAFFFSRASLIFLHASYKQISLEAS